MNDERFAVQLYTLRDATKIDMLGTLRRVARIGYRAVEFAGWGNAAPADIRVVLEEEGMRVVGAHLPFERFESDRDRAIGECLQIGCETAVLPSVPREHLASVDAVRELARHLTGFADAVQAAGLGFAFHNHATELESIDGTTPWHVLVAETSPDLVAFEVDLYWAAYAGADPAAVLRAAPGRVPLVHAKDMAAGSRVDVPAGEGTLPWPEIVAAAGVAGVRWFIAEQDNPADPFRDVETALRNLRKLQAPNEDWSQ
jgi:sugar phosphate isomerase/epimerase